MRVYTVHAPPADAGGANPEDLVFIREGVSWAALVFPVLWLIYRRLWLWLVLYVAAMIALGAAAEETGSPVPALIMLCLHLLLVLEGNELRRRKLARQVYVMAGLAAGDSMEEAEIRYFAGKDSEPAGPVATEATVGHVASVETAREQDADETEVVGMFPTPGGQRP